MAEKLTRERAEQLLAMARRQRDPVGIQFWEDELLRLSNPSAYAKIKIIRAVELADEGERR